MAANLTADPSTIVIGHVSRLSWLSFSKSQGIIDTLNSAAHFMLIVSALLSQIWTRLAETDWDYSTSRTDHKFSLGRLLPFNAVLTSYLRGSDKANRLQAHSLSIVCRHIPFVATPTFCDSI
eukprot:scaffold18808_cov85-Cyclotella_meneghiniana.AAC.11